MWDLPDLRACREEFPGVATAEVELEHPAEKSTSLSGDGQDSTRSTTRRPRFSSGR